MSLDHEPLGWYERGACRGVGPDLFFGMAAERPERRDAREAVAIREYCAGCPVLVECRDYARAHALHGLWGAENEIDRARLGISDGTLVGTAAQEYQRVMRRRRRNRWRAEAAS